MGSITISGELILAVMQSDKVRAALAARADQVAARAESLTAAEDVDGTVTRSGGIRPKGRPFERVAHSNADQEWGTSTTERRRIMGRAAAG